MITTLKKLFALLTPKERKRLGLVFLAVLTTAALEVAGIASIMPFLSMVSNPETIQNNEILSWLYNSLGFESTNRFLFFAGIGVLVIISLSNIFSALTMWALARFRWMRNHYLSIRLLRKYLHSPYSFFLNRNTTDMGKNTLSEVGQVIGGVMRPVLDLFAKGIVAISIFVLLLFINPWLALLITAVLGGTYGLIYALVRRKVKVIGERRYKANQERYKSVNEAFGGIKFLKLLNLEDTFLNRYKRSSRSYSLSKSTNQIISSIPKYLIEIIAFGGLLVIILYLLYTGKGLEKVLPLAGLYAFGGYRLKPHLTTVFRSFTKLRYSAPALESLYEDLKSSTVDQTISIQKDNNPESLPLKKEFEFNSISFKYPGASKPVIQNLDLTIKAHTSVAFAGETGAGKTTIADLILGLLRPDSGKMLVDGTEITNGNLNKWQANLGYISQDIYLQDDTITQNIAFGTPPKDIDMEMVVQSAKTANIHDFVENELPDGYDTVIGERGVRLSGGQRQRVGIARALYYDPEVLVLDEATSDLDTVTERKVYKAIYNVAEVKTLVIIAHRLATIEDCDEIHFLEGGKIVSSGTYKELVEDNSHFQDMAGAGIS